MFRLLLPTMLLLTAQPGRAAETPKVAQRWAVLVGVDDYAYAQKLQYCGADQIALSQQLVASGFPQDQVFLLHDKTDDPRFRPSKGNIERQLNLVLNLADADDFVVIGFSGHGVHLGGKSFLCPGDCSLDDPDTLIGVDDVYDRLKECAAEFKLVVVDACRNDPRPGGGRSMTATAGTRALARTLQDLKLPEGVVLLNSCAPGEISWEDEEFGHGVFMHYVLDGLRGAADANDDDAVSLMELQSYAGARTKTYVANRHSVAQRPFFKGDLTTEALEYALLPVPAGGSPGAGKSIVNSIGMKLTLVPAGEFQMGSSDDDPEAQGDEKPQHPVRITQDFYLGTYEVTRGQFAKFVESESYETESERDDGGDGYDAATNKFVFNDPKFSWRSMGLSQTDEHPVVNVNWNDAVAFCDWLSRKEGATYRLPTEAEWEYAARAGSTSIYPESDGPERLSSFGNTADRSFKAKKPHGYDWGIDADDGYLFAAPVGRFKPNAWGLYDMIGNVWEWCDDWYDVEYYAQSRVDDPAGFTEGEERVYRGGGWASERFAYRSAHREGGDPTNESHYTGFRVVRAM
jgi:formylglycine-generating enzyme required for sulfatase activity